MSAAVSPSPPPPVVQVSPEPFGQTGVRQYLGSFLALLGAAAMAVSIAMWARSTNTSDVLEIVHPYGRTMVSSAWGRLRVASFASGAQAEWTWYYSNRPFTYRGTDPWPPSPWKTLGIEFRRQSADPRVSGGWWLRVKWSTAVVLSAAWPMIHALRQTRHHRAARDRIAVGNWSARYCGRCGRPLPSGADRCAHCGRMVNAGWHSAGP